MSQFDLHRFKLVPLTPIHVGAGEEAKLLPENYRVSSKGIEIVSARAVLAGLDPLARMRWLDDLKRDAEGTIERLKGEAPQELVTGRIAISEESGRELSGKGRRNQIDGFIRAGGRPFLPGSSIKGALRTAWLAREVERQGIRAAAKSKMLEQEAFHLEPGQNATDTDPLRDVMVRDAPLPESATRIDQEHTWKKEDGKYTFTSVGQLHKERLLSVFDGGGPPIVDVAIGLRDDKVCVRRRELDRQQQKTPRRSPSGIAQILTALERHHAPLWQREVETKFFAGEAGERLRQALALFDWLDRSGSDADAALIRIGWAGHAESKSIAGFRRVKRPQVKGAGSTAKEGSTRHVIAFRGHPAPFGWALLVRAERWQEPSRWLDTPAERRLRGASRPGGHAQGEAASTSSVLGQQLKYAKGARVRLKTGEEGILEEDVTEATRGEVMVLLDGSPEPVDVSEIEGPAT